MVTCADSTKLLVILSIAGTLDIVLLLVWLYCGYVIDTLRSELVIVKSAVTSALPIGRKANGE